MAERVFATKGYVASSVRDIAEEAGILSGSLYHHFTSKDDMLAELLQDYLTELYSRYVAASEIEDSAAALRGLIRVGYQSIADHHHIASILHNDYSYLRANPNFEFVHQYYRDVRTLWLTVIERGQQSGVLRDNFDVFDSYRVIMGGVLSASRWFTPGREADFENLIEMASTIYLEGLSRRT
jgi:AcrR family transcriptional regulator